MIRHLFSVLIVILIPYTTSTASSTYDDITPQMNRYVSHMIALGKIIERDKATVSPLLDRIIYQREALGNELRKIYLSSDLGFRRSIALDISDRYDFSLQKYSLSCEIAAIRMIIEGLTQRDMTEDTIIADIRMQNEPLSPEGVWGDPDIGFVGSITGSQYRKTGYGIYEKPLANYVENLGLTAVGDNALSGIYIRPLSRLQSLFSGIEDGDMVMLWGDWCTLSGAEDGIFLKVDTYIARMALFSAKNPCGRSSDDRKFSWTTLAGKKIDGLSGEHVFLLLGYVGDREQPSHIIVWDTYTGKHFYLYDEWMRKWGLMEYRSLTVSL